MTATDEFNKSSNYDPPPHWHHKPWKIRNDYPKESDERPAWLDIDFMQDPRGYSKAVKEYILEGNAEHHFIVQKNTVRDWYHPPWLHYGERGREPINGLKFTHDVPAKYLSENQKRATQGWVCSYFNAPAATVLGHMWADPENPKWDDKHPVKFPVGSIIVQNNFSNATEDEIYTLKGAPTAEACIATVDSTGKSIPGTRKKTADTLRLLQTDFAARDDRFPELGWVFGTFIYDGPRDHHHHHGKPWDHLVPLGIQWGNDPTLTQKAHDAGRLPRECWIDGHALDLFNSLRGDRPWLGFHGRLDGLVDDFMSTCASCHATAQLTPTGKPDIPRVQDPKPKKIPAGAGPGIWVQEDEEAIKRWFRNIPAGEPFDKGYLSADYNRNVQFGYENYLEWRKTHPPHHG